ncbi:MAG: hypothetical protein QM831_22895 [Kofleriaceae bacterium]
MKSKVDYRVVGAAIVIAGGCSIIYNPGNIPDRKDDAIPVDAAADADPSMLVLISSDTTTVNEAEGSGCRPNVLVLRGHNFVNSNTVVTLSPHAGQPDLGSGTPVVTLDASQLAIAGDGDTIAIPIRVDQSDAFKGSNSVRYDITVSQDAQSGRVTQTLTTNPDPNGNGADVPALTVHGLDELYQGSGSAVAIATNEMPPLYSIVEVTSVTGTGPVRIHAVGHITIAGTINFSANGQTGGPGGGNGGVGAGITGAGVTSGTGPNGGAPNAPGKYKGDDQVSQFAKGDNASSGGGGGGGGGLLGAGGAGGGGGGEIEIGAGGDVTIGTLTAKGGTGATSSNNGADGTGGVVVIRAGGTVKATSGKAVDVTAGSGTIVSDPGRARIGGEDVSAITASPKYSRSPTWFASTPMVVRKEQPALNLNGEPGQNVQYYVTNYNGTDTRGPATVPVPPNGMASFTSGLQFYRGLNKLCAYVPDANTAAVDGGQCIWIAYLQAMQ